MIEEIENTLLKKVALNEIHNRLGAKMVPFAGYNMPVRYSSDIEEHLAVRNGVGVFDVSHMGEFIVKGDKALDFLQEVTSNDVSKLSDGQIQYSCLPNNTGGIVDDLTVYRINEKEYYLVVNASNIDKDWNWIKSMNKHDVFMENVSEKVSLFAVQGPQTINTLQKLTSIDLSTIQYYTFVKGTMAGIKDVIISATGYTGSGGFEIYVDNEHAENLWNAIFEAGKEFNIKPIGLGARDTLRLEMGYCLYGNDIDDSTSPIEANLGWITKFTKKFTNSTALELQKKTGVSRKLIGFELLERGIPRSHYEIVNEKGEILGNVTSGTQSPSLGMGIGMGYVISEYSSPESIIFINIRKKMYKAKVVKLPFYKN